MRPITPSFPCNVRPSSSHRCFAATPTMISWHSTIALDGGILKSMEQEQWYTLWEGGKGWVVLPGTRETSVTPYNTTQRGKSEGELDSRGSMERKQTYPTTCLDGWCALVTGASSGIGEACAWRLAKENVKLVLVARRIDRLKQLQEEIQTTYPSAKLHLVNMDVRDTERVKTFLEDLPEEFQQIDILINNAGLALGVASVDTNDLEQAKTMIDTNVTALIAFTRIITPGMVDRQKGHIVNLGSVAGHEAYAQGSVYCASKFAVDAFTTACRHDLMDSPIRVTVISPGAVNTEFSTVRYGDKQRADAFYEGFDPLLAEDIADNVIYALTRPPHVQICDILVYATRQSGAKNIARHV